jgi:hypothetical protein
MSPEKKAFGLNFNLYLGDPDDGVEHISSQNALENFTAHQENLPFGDGLYGHLTLERDGESILEAIPDPIARLLISLTRVLPYLLEGEPESALMQESEHGFLLEPNGENLLFSVFSGNDPYEPEGYLLEAETLPLLGYGEQLVEMGERLVSLFKKNDDAKARDIESIEDLERILEQAQDTLKTARLKNEHGIRTH